MKITVEQLENEMFQYVDSIKDVLSAKIWENILLDCTKNELFILWLVFRQEEVNMTQIAEYIKVPLNTATGIVSRMEKRRLISRERNIQDKRIVTVRMGEQGNAQIQAVLTEFMFYADKALQVFTQDEITAMAGMFKKFKDIMSESRNKETEKQKFKKILIE